MIQGHGQQEVRIMGAISKADYHKNLLRGKGQCRSQLRTKGKILSIKELIVR
jgi:hypothetical protein